MSEKILMVKIKEGLEQPILYLESSYRCNRYKKYYVSADSDINLIKNYKGMDFIIVFIIYENKNMINTLYLGNCEIDSDDRGWVINYKITNVIESDLIIQDIVSNSELDLVRDYDKYIKIEEFPGLIEQIKAIMQAPVTVLANCQRPPESQEYNVLESEAALHKYSQFNENCKRPIGVPREQKADRSEFQRDYERIIHAKAFRRLVDKAQIFTSEKGDHYRTRMTHTLEVNQIARAIARGLNLNMELTEAIALAHDLGHTPFGHQGERTLDNILKNKTSIELLPPDQKNYFGGFKHNFHGLRVVNRLEEKYMEHEGLDLSYQVLEGILMHTKVRLQDCSNCTQSAGNNCPQHCFALSEFLKTGDEQYLFPEYPFATTLEGQIVAVADEIAQRGHDLDDSFSAGLINTQFLENQLSLQKMSKLQEILVEIKEQLQEACEARRAFIDKEELHHRRIVSATISFFITDVITNSLKNMDQFHEDDFYASNHRFSERLIDFSEEGKMLCNYLEKIISKMVINNTEVVRFDNKASNIITKLFKAYYSDPRLLHRGTIERIYIEMRSVPDNKVSDNVIHFSTGDIDLVRKEIEKIKESGTEEYKIKKKVLVRCIVDYIAGMTDSYATDEYNRIYSP